jgi:hypothetical protein
LCDIPHSRPVSQICKVFFSRLRGQTIAWISLKNPRFFDSCSAGVKIRKKATHTNGVQAIFIFAEGVWMVLFGEDFHPFGFFSGISSVPFALDS